jgi:hypothetical protein
MSSDIDFIMRYEGEGTSLEEEKKWFQRKVNDGSIWSLQGFYGRRAQELLDAGIIKYPTKKTKDFYGNPIPQRKKLKEMS